MSNELVPSDDELGIFISGSGEYRVIVPQSWRGRGLPTLAYLVVAALLRTARPNEVEFIHGMLRWAQEDPEFKQHRHGGSPNQGTTTK